MKYLFLPVTQEELRNSGTQLVNKHREWKTYLTEHIYLGRTPFRFSAPVWYVDLYEFKWLAIISIQAGNHSAILSFTVTKIQAVKYTFLISAFIEEKYLFFTLSFAIADMLKKMNGR